MNKLIYLIFLPLYLISATLTVNIAKDSNSTFSIIHIHDDKVFECKKVMNKAFKYEILCGALDKNITKRKIPVENRFFKIYFENRFIIISPKYKFNFYPFSDTYIFDENISSTKVKKSTHWSIVGYKNKNKLFGIKENDILDFDIPINLKELPMVGELNFELKPIINTQEAKEIDKIKRLYNKKYYERVIKSCDNFLENEKNLFTSTAKLYKLRALNRLIIDKSLKELDPMDLVKLSQEWIDNNPSNIQIPEVISYIAKAYIKMNRKKKSKKYYDILDLEYPDSIYNFEAKLYHARKLYKNHNKSKAIAEYKDVLYNTKNFDIASQAAIYLTQAYLDNKKINKAKNFMEKILNADSQYIINHPIISHDIAKKFSENNQSKLSLKIALYLKSKNSELDCDELDKDIAYWYELSGDNEKAIEGYRKYLQDHKNGKFVDFVKEHLDIVGLATKENNQTKRLNYLDKMIEKYKDNLISKKAFIEKANIFLNEKKYEDILAMSDDIKKAGGEKLLTEVAKKLFYKDLKLQKCKEAFQLKSDYNISIDDYTDESIYNCYVKLLKNKEAISFAKDKLKDKSIKSKLKWTYELVKLYKKNQNYKALLLVANDLEKLQKIVGTDIYNDICFDKVQAYYHIGNLDELMIREAQKCAKLLPNDVRNLDSYERIVEYAKKHDKNNLIIIYANKMIELQNRYKLSTYSPMIELDYIEALRREAKYEEALKIDLNLLYKDLLDQQKAHVLYLAGYLSEKLKKVKEAKEFYVKCGEIVEDSAWVELCSENIELLSE